MTKKKENPKPAPAGNWFSIEYANTEKEIYKANDISAAYHYAEVTAKDKKTLVLFVKPYNKM